MLSSMLLLLIFIFIPCSYAQQSYLRDSFSNLQVIPCTKMRQSSICKCPPFFQPIKGLSHCISISSLLTLTSSSAIIQPKTASTKQQLSDPNCNSHAPSNNICTSCKTNYFLTNYSTCVRTPLRCNTINPDGTCSLCQTGFAIMHGLCLPSSLNIANLRDIQPVCQFAGNNGKCIKCLSRFYPNQIGICQSVNSLCNDYNPNTGKCTTCFQGYRLNNGICQLGGDWNGSDSSFCKSVDKINNYCTSCSEGYRIQFGNCVKDEKLMIVQQNSKYCVIINERGDCISCLPRYYLSDGLCSKVSETCKSYDEYFGYCTSCYQGYRINSHGDCSRRGQY